MTRVDQTRTAQIALAVGLAVALHVTKANAEAPSKFSDLSALSLEELSQIEVTSVSKRPEPIGQAPAAVYVINADDIRRSGATNLPEVLQLAPNLQVQKLNSVDFGISARGFNGFLTANKLLVMVDGRSIYEPMHSGVFWDARQQILHDISRIEVVSGPGGALYGANAVNGVINIISKDAHETQGAYLEAGGGDQEQFLVARYGGSLGGEGAWRAYAMGNQRSERLTASANAEDKTDGISAGIRTDSPAVGGALTFQGDLFKNDVPLNYEVRGGSLAGRWSGEFGPGTLQIASYADHTRRSAGNGEVETETTYDLHAQHALAPIQRHQLVVGGGYRLVDSSFHAAPGVPVVLDPSQRMVKLFDVYLQDQVALREDLTLTLGLKYENSSLSGDELMPSARLAWRRDDGSLIWAAASRAVRTSTRIESDLVRPGFFVGQNFDSENVLAYELGYRASIGRRADLSVSTFYNAYDDLRTTEFVNGTSPPIYFANGAAGASYGVEAWGNLDINSRWRLSAGVATLHKSFETKPGVVDLVGLEAVGDDPAYQLTFRSRADLTDKVELDVRLRAVDKLQPSGLKGYLNADARLGWRVTQSVELSATASNLFDNDRLESAYPTRATTVGRRVFASIHVGY